MIKDKITGDVFKGTDYSIKEVFNGKDELTWNVPADSDDAKKLINEQIITETKYSNDEFVVKKISGDDVLEVTAQLNLDDFKSRIFIGFSKTGDPFNILNTVVPEGWTVEDNTGISTSKTVELDGPTALDVADSVINIFGIAIRYDTVRKAQTLYNPSNFQSAGEYATKELNLVSLNRYTDTSGLINRLYARGKDGLTFAEINDGKDYVDDTSYLSGKVVCGFIKDDRFENAQSLLSYTKEQLAVSCKPTSSYECSVCNIAAQDTKYSFLKLELMSVITLLDTDRNRRVDHQIVEKTVHPYDRDQDEVVLSTSTPSLTDETTYVNEQIKNPNSEFRQQIQNDMDRIANAIIEASGGHIIINKGDDGKLAEILVMDTNDKSTAVDVMRINKEGIAFSTSGYNGPFNGAWKLSGEFFTQFIATWKLSAALLVTGILRSNDGTTFYLDLDNGILRMEADELKISGKTVESIAQEKADAAQNAASKELADFAETVTSNVDNLQSQIDGQIQTWFYSHVPSADNAPANSWITTEEKNNHLGDLFYIVNNATQGGQAYRWALVNGSYKWVLLEDAEVAKALASAAKAQDTADSKRRVFVTTPVPPYDVGDLWTQGASGDLMRCKTARQGGSYVSSDWEKATKYTDNTALTEFVNGTYKSTVEQLKQQADQKAETWHQSTDPSLNWSASEKPEHSGDIWYNTSTQQSYIYNGTAWQEMKTNPPEAVFDKIDGKAQVFVSQPVPPYSVGDLWTDSSTGDLMRCKTSRTSGAFNASDWILATDYVTSSDAADIANGAVSAQTQIDIFNKLTNNGALQGLYMQDGKLYINAEYLATGIIKKGNSFWDLTTGNLQMEGNFRTVSGGLTADLWGGVFKLLVDNKEVVGVSSIAGTTRGVVNVSENGVVKTAINGGDFYTGSIQASNGISAGGSVTASGDLVANTNIYGKNIQASGDLVANTNIYGKNIQASGSITAGKAIRFNAVRPNDGQNTLYTTWVRGTELTSNDWVLVGRSIAPYSNEKE